MRTIKSHYSLRNKRLVHTEPYLEFSWKKESRLFHRVTVYHAFRHHVLLNHRNFLKTNKHFVSTTLLSDLERKYLVHHVPQPLSSSFVPTFQGTSLWVMSNLSIFQNANPRKDSCGWTQVTCHTLSKITGTEEHYSDFFFLSLSSLKWHLTNSLSLLVQATLFYTLNSVCAISGLWGRLQFHLGANC